MEQTWSREILRPTSCMMLALALLILPLRWVLAWIMAAAVHEACHLLAVRLCGGKIDDIMIGANGALITVSELSTGRTMICSLAGPLGALLLLFAAEWLPATAICAIFQSAYNLLPLYPLDGGQVLRNLMCMLFMPETACRICRIVQWIFIAVIAIAAVYASVLLNLGWMPLIFAVVLFARMNFGKIPCKPCRQRVQ